MSSDKSRVFYQDGSIHFSPANGNGWQIPVQRIRAIIEYTTEEGPFAPDHFLVFVDRSATEHHLPLSAEGCSDVIKQVGEVLRADVDLNLSSSTKFASRVVFPDSIAGSDGYKLEKAKRSLTQRLFHLNQRVSMILSDQVKKTLE